MLEQPVGDGGVVLGVVSDVGHRAFAHVEVAREAGIAREFGRLDPEIVVAHGVLVGLRQPLLVVVSGLLVGRVLRHDHRGEKRRLRAGEVVGAIGVEHRAVVLDLVEEVLDDAARVVTLAVFEQADDDEVAVPAVHLVEAASGHDVLVGQIEQAVGVQAGRPGWCRGR